MDQVKERTLVDLTFQIDARNAHAQSDCLVACLFGVRTVSLARRLNIRLNFLNLRIALAQFVQTSELLSVVNFFLYGCDSHQKLGVQVFTLLRIQSVVHRAFEVVQVEYAVIELLVYRQGVVFPSHFRSYSCQDVAKLVNSVV